MLHSLSGSSGRNERPVLRLAAIARREILEQRCDSFSQRRFTDMFS